MTGPPNTKADPQPAAQALRVLLVEDSENDALLIMRELRRSGYAPVTERVETAAAMRAALERSAWDIILSDYVMPSFGGLEALTIAIESGLGLPFILLSNKVSEETLVEAMRAGAADFIMKDRLNRLGPVVKRELADATARRGLAQAQIEWRSAFDAVQDAMFIYDADYRVVRANLAYAERAGLPIAEVTGKPYWNVFPKLAGPTPGSRGTMARGGLSEERIDCADGKTYMARSFAVKRARDESAYFVQVIQDVTERERAEQALLKSEQRYRSYIELTGQIAWHTDGAGLVTDALPLWQAFTGQSAAQIMGGGWAEAVHPDDRESAAQSWRDALASGSVYEAEYRLRRGDGIYRDFFARGVPVPDPAGGVREWIGTAIDITERLHEERRTAALLQLTTSAAHTDEKTLLQQGLDTLQRLTDSRIGFLHFVSEDQNELELVTWSSDTLAHYCHASHDTHYPVAAAGIWADSVRLKRPVVVNDYASAPNKRGLPEGHSVLQRFISVPVFDGDLVRMIVGVGNAARDYAESDVETIQLFAFDLYRIVQNKRTDQQIRVHLAQLEAAFMSTVGLATSLSELRDPYTTGHERRVADIAAAIGAALGFDARRQEGLRVAGLLHDVGKITIPAEILSKPGKLSAIEYELIKGHAQASYEVLKGVQFPWPVAEVALQHHERLDGSGYPQGLKGDAILLEARILAVADVIEAMASHRPYRPGMGIDKALAEIERGRGAQYDPAVADACLKLFREQGYAIPA